jgi:hypothetical protein
MNGFIPDKLETPKRVIPWYEDQGGEKIPGRGTSKSIAVLKSEIVDLLSELGAGDMFFESGKYPDVSRLGSVARYGFQIKFSFQGALGRIDCAALPIRAETANKKDRALAQALYLLRDELQAMVYAVVHKPGAIPLVPYLIGAGGKTVTEALIEGATLALPQGAKQEVLIGEIVE